MSLKEKLKARRAKEQKLRRHKELLVQSVRQHVLPAIVDRGFSVAPKQIQNGSVDGKSMGTSPFEQLRRPRPDGGVDLIEIQFMTYQRAAFRINASAVPKEGMMTVGGHRTAEECLALGVHDLEMYACPRWWIWFSLWFWRFRLPVQADYDKLAIRVVTLVPELDSALRDGLLGPHMRRIQLLPPKLRADRSASKSLM